MKRSIYEHFICFIHTVLSLLNTILVIKLTTIRIETYLYFKSYDNHSGLLDPLGINVVR